MKKNATSLRLIHGAMQNCNYSHMEIEKKRIDILLFKLFQFLANLCFSSILPITVITFRI